MVFVFVFQKMMKKIFRMNFDIWAIKLLKNLKKTVLIVIIKKGLESNFYVGAFFLSVFCFLFVQLKCH